MKVDVDIVRWYVVERLDGRKFDGRRLDRYRLDVRKRSGVRTARRVSMFCNVSYETMHAVFIDRIETAL